MNDTIAAQRQILEEVFVINFRGLETDEDQLHVLNWMTAVEKIGLYLFFTGGTIEMIARSVTEDVLIRRFVLSCADTARLMFAQENIDFLDLIANKCIKLNAERYRRHEVALLPTSVRAELRIDLQDIEKLVSSSDWYLYLYGFFVTGAFQTFSATQEEK